MHTQHDTDPIPNHHAHYPPFRGWRGALAAVSMLRRDADGTVAADLTGLRPGDRLIDIGCGPGSAARAAARAGASVTGLDPAPVMLRVARLAPGARKVRWQVGTAERLPFGDATFDVAWSIACVHHWADVPAGVAEVGRVLVPGGRLLAMERRIRPKATGHASHGWTDAQAESFAAVCRERGFTDVTAQQTRSDGRTVLVVVATRVAGVGGAGEQTR